MDTRPKAQEDTSDLSEAEKMARKNTRTMVALVRGAADPEWLNELQEAEVNRDGGPRKPVIAACNKKRRTLED